MIPPPFVQIRHAHGGYLKRIGPPHLVESWALLDDQRDAGFLEPEDAQHFFGRADVPIAWPMMSIVPGLGCGCCGRFTSYGGHPRAPEFVEVAPGRWRCDKHMGRLPCEVTGCGRTFAMKADDSYDMIVLCGAHWRQAPLRMRRHVAAIRRKARRYGWTDRLLRLHNLGWHRAFRAIQRGHRMDTSEIDRMFGWDDNGD